MAGKIFVNYRRADDPNGAARVRDGLVARFGKSNVFMDVDNLLAGQHFDEELGKALGQCDVLLAIIGPRWMDQLKGRGARDERDYVREEIAGALQRRIVVIPVRVGREGELPPLPRPDELPEDIRELVRYQKHDVSHEHFRRDIAALIEAIIAIRKTRQPRLGKAGLLRSAQLAAVIAGVMAAAYAGAHYSGAPVPWPGAQPSEPRAIEPQAKAKGGEPERQGSTPDKSNDQSARSPTPPQPGQGASGLAVPAGAGDVIKVGILHSLSGTMATSETSLKDVMLMLIDEQNKKGGLLGRKLEAVVVDPASNWPLFATKARELITQEKVAAVFGCYTSLSRKSVLPVFKQLNSILFYPAQSEGEESERNIFYTGATPNQQAIPAVDYLMSAEGGSAKRWVLAGTDYVFARTTNKILESYLIGKGVSKNDILIDYTPFGQSDWKTIVSAIKTFGTAGKKTAVVSTISGDANVPFYKELTSEGLSAKDIPVVALSVGEEDLAGIDITNFVGQLAARNYFMSVDTSANKAFIETFRAFTQSPKRVTDDPIEAHVIGFNMWVKAVEKVGTTDAEKVIAALPGTQVPNLTGGLATMLSNHHITKPVMVGKVRGDGQFDVIWRTKELVPGDAWSDYLEGSDHRN